MKIYKDNFAMTLLIYGVIPIISLLLLLLKINEFVLLLKDIHEYAPRIIYGALIAGTLFTYYVNFASPYKKYQTIAEARWSALDKITETLFKEYQQYDLNFNIMIPRRRYFQFIEPKRPESHRLRFQFCVDVFDVVWTYGEHGVHQDLKITVNQGLCGLVFKDSVKASLEHIRGFILPETQFSLYNMNQHQIKMTENIQILVSCPISIEKKGQNGKKPKVVGVLNVESRFPQSKELINSLNILEEIEVSDNEPLDEEIIEIINSISENGKNFYKKILYLSEIYSKLHT